MQCSVKSLEVPSDDDPRLSRIEPLDGVQESETVVLRFNQGYRYDSCFRRQKRGGVTCGDKTYVAGSICRLEGYREVADARYGPDQAPIRDNLWIMVIPPNGKLDRDGGYSGASIFVWIACYK